MRRTPRARRLISSSSAFASRHPALVLLVWVSLAGILNVAIPQLEQTVAKHSVAFLPQHIPSTETLTAMSDAFDVPDSSALGSIVLVDDTGIDAADQQAYRNLVRLLRADLDNVAYVLDTYGTGTAGDIGLSPDGKAINLVVAAVGEVGSTQAHHNTNAIRHTIDALPKPPGLQILYTGPSPTLADLFSAIDFSLLIITAASVLLIAMILLIMYRSVITAMIPLVTIGIALGVARPIVSLLGLTDTMAVSNFTIALMTAMVLGATTDYAIFVLGGYHEGRRSGRSVDAALAGAARRVNEIIVASGLTIAMAASAMAFAELGMFRAAGPPIVVAMVVAVAVALTVPAALITLLGRRGRVEPRHASPRRWQRRGAAVVRRAVPLTVVSLITLICAAAPLIGMRVNFDENAMQLGNPESAAGYEAVQRHWGVNEVAPEFLLIRSDHDMRNTDDLAALDRVAAAVAALPEIAYVRFLTRPDGRQLHQSTVGYQTGVVADGLDHGQRQLAAQAPQLHRLAGGITALHDGARAATEQMPELVAGVRSLSELAQSLLVTLHSADASTRALTGGADLRQVVDALRAWLPVLDAALSTLAAHTGALNALTALDAALGPVVAEHPAPQCQADPLCTRARAGLADLDAYSNGALGEALRHARARGDTPAAAINSVRAALPGLRDTLAKLSDLLASQRATDATPQLANQLTRLVNATQNLQWGMTRLAAGLAEVRGGVDDVAELTGRLDAGLQQASGYLRALSLATTTGAGTGFYLPPEGFDDPGFRAGAQLMMSADGTAARMIVIWAINPYSDQALDVVREITETAHTAAEGTPLSESRFASTGLASQSAETRTQMWQDFAICAVVALLGVFAVLVVLLRSIAAPLFMVAMVTLSFAAAAGVSVIVWQHIIGIDLDWSVLPVSFIALIAVGADYSMLFAARIREESHDGMIRGIIRGFGTTGSVITTAGIVFAVTMFALMTGRVINLVQIGFMVGTGLLIDITVVRTILVPAAMALIGERIWWPASSATTSPTETIATQHHSTKNRR